MSRKRRIIFFGNTNKDMFFLDHQFAYNYIWKLS